MEDKKLRIVIFLAMGIPMILLGLILLINSLFFL